jgi:hypothetical protein
MTLYVKWTPELQAKFKELREKEGEQFAATLLETSTRNLYDFIRGISRGKRRTGSDKQGTAPRKFVELKKVELLAEALDDRDLDDVEALTQAEWKARGDWDIPEHLKVEDAEETPAS